MEQLIAKSPRVLGIPLAKIPNILSIFRILLVPIIIVLLAVDASGTAYTTSITDNIDRAGLGYKTELNLKTSITWLIGACLFAVASATDWLDGFLARKYKIESNFGKFIDPVADKVLINSVLIVLSWKDIVPFYFTIILITRDIIVDSMRMNLSSKGIVLAADIYGKLKTITLMIAMVMILFLFHYNPNQIFEFTAKVKNEANQTEIFQIYEKMTPGKYFGIQNVLMIMGVFLAIVSGTRYVLLGSMALGFKSNFLEKFFGEQAKLKPQVQSSSEHKVEDAEQSESSKQ